jgi:hypothetical protein
VVEVDPDEQLKSVASQWLSGDQLAAFLAVADAKKCVNANGEIDAEAVIGNLRTLYRLGEQRPQPRQWGQTTGSPPGKNAGDDARAALQKRHGVQSTYEPPPGPDAARGQRGRAALQKRHARQNAIQ